MVCFIKYREFDLVEELYSCRLVILWVNRLKPWPEHSLHLFLILSVHTGVCSMTKNLIITVVGLTIFSIASTLLCQKNVGSVWRASPWRDIETLMINWKHWPYHYSCGLEIKSLLYPETETRPNVIDSKTRPRLMSSLATLPERCETFSALRTLEGSSLR